MRERFHWRSTSSSSIRGRRPRAGVSVSFLRRLAAHRLPPVFCARLPQWIRRPDRCHWLGQIEAASGNSAQALLELQAVERLGAPVTNPTLTAGLLYSYSRIDRSDDVARLAVNVENLAASGPVGAGTWALMYLALGDSDEAHRWLDTAVHKIERHEPDTGFLNLMTIKTNPHANPVLEEPRFRKLRDRIGAVD